MNSELLRRWGATKPSIRRSVATHPNLPWKVRVPGGTIHVRTFADALARLDHWYRYEE